MWGAPAARPLPLSRRSRWRWTMERGLPHDSGAKTRIEVRPGELVCGIEMPLTGGTAPVGSTCAEAGKEGSAVGEMVDGAWRSDEDLAHAEDGHFRRPPTRFRGTVAEGGPHPPAVGRYHLYVSLACPWAHRALIVRRLKGLEGIVGLSVTHWLMREEGWSFAEGPGVVPDPGGARVLHEVYRRADPRYTGRVTVPVLWDREAGTIVNNESSEVIRIFDRAFDAVGARPGSFYPEALRPEIDAVNARIQDTLNDGVYRAGFATTQEAYEAAVAPLFDTMDWLEERLSRQNYLCGGEVTEADWRLFTTLVRFDAVYHGHFKCNLRRLVDYPALRDYARRLYRWPGIAETVDFEHIKGHYYGSHRGLNPTGIVPLGPAMEWYAPARRV